MMRSVLTLAALALVSCDLEERFDSRQQSTSPAAEEDVDLDLTGRSLNEKGSSNTPATSSVELQRIPAIASQIRIVCHNPEKAAKEVQVRLVAVAITNSGNFRVSKIIPKSCLMGVSIVLGAKITGSENAKLNLIVIYDGKAKVFKADHLLKTGGGKWRLPRANPNQSVSNQNDASDSVSNQSSGDQVSNGSDGTLGSDVENPPSGSAEQPCEGEKCPKVDCGDFPDGREICRIK
jgi:hypothetical protein